MNGNFASIGAVEALVGIRFNFDVKRLFKYDS